MMTMEQQAQEAFQTLLQGHYAQVGNKDLKIREKAWNRFLQLGLPMRNSELFRYLRMRVLFSKNYPLAEPSTISPELVDAHLLPECANSTLVFVNGFFAPALSRTAHLTGSEAAKKIIFSTISEAVSTFWGVSQWPLDKSLKR